MYRGAKLIWAEIQNTPVIQHANYIVLLAIACGFIMQSVGIYSFISIFDFFSGLDISSKIGGGFSNLNSNELTIVKYGLISGQIFGFGLTAMSFLFVYHIIFGTEWPLFSFTSSEMHNTWVNQLPKPYRQYLYLKLLAFLAAFILLCSLPVLSKFIIRQEWFHLPSGFTSIEKTILDRELRIQESTKLLLSQDFYLNIFGIGMIPAIMEELLFRGFIQSVLIKRWGAFIGILVTSILFGVLHLELFNMMPRILLGILLGWLFFRTNNLLVPIFAHATNNIFAVVASSYVKFPTTELGKTNEIYSPPLTLTIISAFFCIFGIYLFNKWTIIPKIPE